MGKSKSETSLEAIEAGLERLMPKGLNDVARIELEETVDNLAASTSTAPISRDKFWSKASFLKIAASLAVVSAVGAVYLSEKGIKHPSVAVVPELNEVSSSDEIEPFQFVGHRTWIQSGRELEPQPVDQFEEVSRGWGYSGIEEERIHHVSSGYEVIVQRGFDAELHSMGSL